MKKKNGFVSLTTIVILIVGITTIMLANLALLSMNNYLLTIIKHDARDNLRYVEYPQCTWSSEVTMVKPIDGSASNSVYVTCTDVKGLSFLGKTLEDLNDPEQINANVAYLLQKDSQINVTFIHVYEESHGYKMVFGLASNYIGTYKIRLKPGILYNGKYKNMITDSNNIYVESEV